MKIAVLFWYLYSTPLVFSDSPAHDASADLPPEVPLKEPPASRHAQHQLQHQFKTTNDTAASKLLPLSSPEARALKDAAASKFLPANSPLAPALNDAAVSKQLPLKSPVAPAFKSAAAKILSPKSPAALHKVADAEAVYSNLPHQELPGLSGASSDASAEYFEEESRPDVEDRDENSLFPEMVEEYFAEEEIVQTNDESELTKLTDDFLTDYLSNEEHDTETELEA